jgi:hypothetical protein
MKHPKFADVLTRAEEIAAEWEAFEVAACIAAEEPARYGMARKLTREQQDVYDRVVHMAYREKCGPITTYGTQQAR